MGALDCVSGNLKLTDSTEVFAINVASTTTLNEPKRDLESQSSDSRCNNIMWRLLVDIPLFLLVLALIGLYELAVIPSHKSGFYCNDPALSHKFTGDTFSMSLFMICVLLGPVVFFLVTEFILDEKDYSSKSRLARASFATLWLYRSYIYGFLFNLSIVELMKGIIGSPRPTFFDLCQPDTGKTCNGSEYVETFTCTSSYSRWYQSDSYSSFPSGHTSLSVYGGFFVAWYLQKRAFDWRHRTVFLVPALQLVCASFAAGASLTRITDHRHHWWDVAFGAVIGVVSLLYGVLVLCKNFSEPRSKRLSDMQSEQSQCTVKTI